MNPLVSPPYRGQDGLALPVTLFALAVLALLTAALAGTTTAELESERLVDWDRRALYLAEAGLEHQIFALKQNKDAGDVGTVSMGGSALEGRYNVIRQCVTLASAGGTCTDNRESRTWRITSRGELWQGATLVHTRTVEALVEIRYCGGADNVKGCPTAGALYGSPEAVLVHRWEVR